jgi:hypothetical protein
VCHSISLTHWWWSVSFNFINTLMVVCIIQFHQHTDVGVYHLHTPPSVCWLNWMIHSTISVLMKLNDTHHHQCVNEIEWYTPPSVCWWNWVECIIQFHQHTDGGVCNLISFTHWWWCVSFNFITTLMVVCVIQFHQQMRDSYHNVRQ